MIHRFLQRWEHFWFRPAPPHALALTRIGWGVFSFLYVVRLLPHITMLFSDQGVVTPLLAHRVTDFWQPLFLPPSPGAAWALFLLLLLLIVSFTAGYRLRLSAAGIIILSLYFWQLSLHHNVAGFERYYLFAYIVFLGGGADKTFSIRMLRTGSWRHWEPVSILPQRLLTVQMTLVYAGTALHKLWLPDWQDESVLSAVLLHPDATGAAYWIARQHWPAWVFGGLLWGLKLFEVTLPVGLWTPRFQYFAFAAGAAFHLLNGLLLSIWSFVGFIPFYLLFLKPERVQRMLMCDAPIVTNFSVSQ